MGMRKYRRYSSNIKPSLSLDWAGNSIDLLFDSYHLPEYFQAATLNLVGVKHLFVVPRLRSSTYVRTLSQAFIELRHCHPGEIQIEDLPDLRNFIVVDNAEESRADLAKLHIKSMVDWREILLWRDDTTEARIQRDIMAGLQKEEIINLQFTRWAIVHRFLDYSVLRRTFYFSGTTGLPKAVSVRLLCLVALE